MDEKLLLKIAIVLAIIMIPITSFFLSISSKEIHSLVLKGEVKSVSKGEVTFVKLETILPVVFFDSVEINKSNVIIRGRLEEYNGKVEFIGEQIIG